MSNSVKLIIKIILFTILATLISFTFQALMLLDQKFAFFYLTTLILGALYFTSKRHEKLKSLERMVHLKSYTLDTLLKVNSIFMDMDEDEGHYDFILTAAVEIIPKAHKGSFLFYNPQTGLYDFKASHGYNLEELQNVSFSFEETFLYRHSEETHHQPVIIKNIKEFDRERLPPSVSDELEKAGGYQIEECISSPIVIDGQIVGILNVDSEDTGAFDELDKQLLYFFSTQIGMALKHKYLIDETIQFNKFDKLTGAYNRNHFEKLFNAYRNHSLEQMETYALILCDLNNLKMINDTYGHTAGDQILIAFSSKIKELIRDIDVFSRIGGDEFVILLKDMDAHRAEKKMSEIHAQFKNFDVNYHGHNLPVSFSYGISVSPDDSMVYDVLVKIADARMYAFKNQIKSQS